MIAMQRSRYQNKQDMNRAAAHRQKVRLDQQGLGDVYGKMRGGGNHQYKGAGGDQNGLNMEWGGGEGLNKKRGGGWKNQLTG